MRIENVYRLSCDGNTKGPEKYEAIEGDPYRVLVIKTPGKCEAQIFVYGTNKKEAEKAAHNNGWRDDGHGGNLCPECAKERDAE